MSKYLDALKKKDLFGCFRIGKNETKPNTNSKQKEEEYKFSTTVLSITRCTLTLSTAPFHLHSR